MLTLETGQNVWKVLTGLLQVVQGRGLQLGDAALVDFDAKQTDTGEVFQGAKRRKTHMDTDSADMQFLPGLDHYHPVFPLYCSIT